MRLGMVLVIVCGTTGGAADTYAHDTVDGTSKDNAAHTAGSVIRVLATTPTVFSEVSNHTRTVLDYTENFKHHRSECLTYAWCRKCLSYRLKMSRSEPRLEHDNLQSRCVELESRHGSMWEKISQRGSCKKQLLNKQRRAEPSDCSSGTLNVPRFSRHC